MKLSNIQKSIATLCVLFSSVTMHARFNVVSLRFLNRTKNAVTVTTSNLTGQKNVYEIVPNKVQLKGVRFEGDTLPTGRAFIDSVSIKVTDGPALSGASTPTCFQVGLGSYVPKLDFDIINPGGDESRIELKAFRRKTRGGREEITLSPTHCFRM